jgi:hypothetical protein
MDFFIKWYSMLKESIHFHQYFFSKFTIQLIFDKSE